jgi:integration host factor subunit alpha
MELRLITFGKDWRIFMTLTKKRIIDSIQIHCGYSKDRSMKLVEALVEIIKSTLESGEDVLITGFGKF